MNPTPRFLFVLKYRDNYTEFKTPEDGGKFRPYYSSGLLNSARFVTEMLSAAGVDVKLVQVVDNNCIDREVHAYKPTHVIIEAFWVVPEKFEILQKLHPKVQWIIRGHSEIPFLSNEGIAVDWLNRYVQWPNVGIATNSVKSLHDIRVMIRTANPDWTEDQVHAKVAYMPNYYPTKELELPSHNYNKSFVDVACFGAIRPLKNNLLQAIAALEFASQQGKKLRFHINGTRSEQGGANNLKNLEALFEHNPDAELIEHNWMTHDSLLKMLRTIDISMNVSFTETFNIVAADSVMSGCALAASSEVYWASSFSHADPTDSKDMVRVMNMITNPIFSRFLKFLNYRKLRSFSNSSKEVWMDYVRTR